MMCSLDERESVSTSFYFLLFPFILINLVVGLRQSIADLRSHLHMEARTPQWPWVAVTAGYCSDSDWVILSETGPALHLCAKPSMSFQLTGLLVNDKALLSFALALRSCFWKGMASGKPKEGAVMRSQGWYVNENQAI